MGTMEREFAQLHRSKETKAHYLNLGPVHFTKLKLC